VEFYAETDPDPPRHFPHQSDICGGNTHSWNILGSKLLEHKWLHLLFLNDPWTLCL